MLKSGRVTVLGHLPGGPGQSNVGDAPILARCGSFLYALTSGGTSGLVVTQLALTGAVTRHWPIAGVGGATLCYGNNRPYESPYTGFGRYLRAAGAVNHVGRFAHDP